MHRYDVVLADEEANLRRGHLVVVHPQRVEDDENEVVV